MVCQQIRRQNLLMNVYETKQIYTIIPYEIDVLYDIPVCTSRWRFFRKSYQMTSPYVCSSSDFSPQDILFKCRVKKMQNHKRHLSWNSSAFVVMVVKVFWTLNCQRKPKEILPRWQKWQESSPINDRGYRKKSAVFTRLVRIH